MRFGGEFKLCVCVCVCCCNCCWPDDDAITDEASQPIVDAMTQQVACTDNILTGPTNALLAVALLVVKLAHI